MKRTDITRTIASLLITAAMLGVTGCGNVNTDTSSAAPKATTTASSTEASATTTTEATLTSQSEETTSLSATTTSSTTSASTSSGKSSTTTKGGSTTKSNSPASNGGTVNNNQSYSHSTANNGSGNNSYSNDNNNNNSYQPQQTERQTERQTTTKRQTTTTAKKTKPKPTTTTTAKPKFELTQNDIDRLKRELQAYSNEIARPIFKDIYAECGYSSVDELLSDIGWMNLDNSSWGTPDTVSPDTYSSYDELYRKVKGHVDDLYTVVKDAQIVIYTEWHGDGSAINSDGKPAWEIYLIY